MHYGDASTSVMKVETHCAWTVVCVNRCNFDMFDYRCYIQRQLPHKTRIHSDIFDHKLRCDRAAVDNPVRERPTQPCRVVTVRMRQKIRPTVFPLEIEAINNEKWLQPFHRLNARDLASHSATECGTPYFNAHAQKLVICSKNKTHRYCQPATPLWCKCLFWEELSQPVPIGQIQYRNLLEALSLQSLSHR